MHYSFIYYLLGFLIKVNIAHLKVTFVLGTWRADGITANNRDVEWAVLTVWSSPVCRLVLAPEVDLD